MAWNISAKAIRNPAPPIMLFLALMLAGIVAFPQLPINTMPNVEFPTFTVTTARPGAAPSELEAQVAQKIESALTSVDGIKRMNTTLRPGVATTTVELREDVEISRAVDDARDAIAQVRPDLPSDIDEPIITRMDAAAMPLGYFAVEAPGVAPEDISWYIDNELSRQLLTVPGVSTVKRFSGSDREVRVELDPDRMAAFGATAEDVNNQLAALNLDAPGGRSEIGGLAQSIRTLGGADSVDNLSATRINLPGGRSVRLGDIGTVRDGASEANAIARLDGKPVVGFFVQRSKTASSLKSYDALVAKFRAIEKARPGYKIIVLASTVESVRALYESSVMSILEGAVLAVIVVLLVLRDWRATIIAAVAIPLSIVPTFAAMHMFGFTLNTLTLISLGLVVGVLVDDAIVEIENIVRHMRMGKRPYRASLDAADEIGLAVVATSFAIVSVFVPVAFMTGTIGQFFKSFGITITVSVLISLLVARLITPLMAAFFLKDTGHEEKPSKLRDHYVHALSWSIKHPWITVGIGVLTFIASIALVPTIPATFVPRTDSDYVAAQLEFSPGTTLRDADAITSRVANMLRKPYVKAIFQQVDGANGSADSATLYLTLTPRKDRPFDSYGVQQELRPILSQVKDVRASFQVQDAANPAGVDIQLDFIGDDAAKVAAAADRLVSEIKQYPELADVKSSASLKRPELQIRPKPDVAAELGVSASAIATAIRVGTGGEIDQRTAKFSIGDRQIPIRVLLAPWARADIESLKALRVASARGESVRLDAVADISFGLGDATIERRDRQRKVSVSANVVEGATGNALRKIMAAPAAKALPPGVRLLPAGDSADLDSVMGQFIIAMSFGVLLIYSVLVLLFRDFFQPVTIMTALPMSMGGATLGLIATQQPMSIIALIGILMLMGIVTKNSILLVDFAVERMHAGMSRTEALLEAGSKRVRPIIMTTIAMSAGMLPLVLGLGPDGAFRQGMAAVVIGGLVLSTALSLLFVPASFVLIARLENWVAPKLGVFSTFDPKLDKEGAQAHAPEHPVHQPGADPAMRPAAE